MPSATHQRANIGNGKIQAHPKICGYSDYRHEQSICVVIATAHGITLVTHAAASELRLSSLNMKPKKSRREDHQKRHMTLDCSSWNKGLIFDALTQYSPLSQKALLPLQILHPSLSISFYDSPFSTLVTVENRLFSKVSVLPTTRVRVFLPLFGHCFFLLSVSPT